MKNSKITLIKSIILTALLLCPFFARLSAQTNNIEALSIGDQVPDVQINHVANYQKADLRFSDFKNKLIIIDFWGADCGPCIAAFPKLDSLQVQFGDKIQIILATPTPKHELDSIYKVRERSSPLHRYHPKLVSVTEDSMLTQLFHFEIIPHDVWIDGSGKVRAFTEGRYVTAENIEKMLIDKNLRLPEKNDMLAYDAEKSTFPQIFTAHPEGLLYYSTVMNYQPGLWGAQYRFIVDTAAKTVRISRANATILDFYGDVFSGGRVSNPYKWSYFDFGKRVILHVKDSSRFFFTGKAGEDKQQWTANHSYNYETVLPLMPEKQAYHHYLSDINAYFGLNAKWIDDTVTCMAIIRTSDQDKFRYKGARTYGATGGGIKPDGTFFIKGLVLSALRDKLSEFNKKSPYIFVDKTGYDDLVDIEIHAQLSDLPAVERELRSNYDLDIVEKRLPVKMLVISDN